MKKTDLSTSIFLLVPASIISAILFIVRLAGVNISWFWVFSPFWITATLMAVFALFLIIYLLLCIKKTRK